MPTLSNRKDLFRKPTTKDKLTLLQSLFDDQLLDTASTLALLNLIHRDLSADKEIDRSLYKRYAQSVENMRYYMFDILQQVTEAWKVGKTGHDE